MNACPTELNFASHLAALNAPRAAKPAYIDDTGQITYGQLAERVARMAGALRQLGLRREERILLLMQDTADWPVVFLGALHAGVVPVAVNTLLTADDYAYILDHSRVRAAFVSDALLPTLRAALALAPGEVEHLVVSRPGNALADGALALEPLLAAAPWRRPRARCPTKSPSGCIRPARPASPRAWCTPMAICGIPPNCMPSRCWASARMTSRSRPPSCSSPTAWATA